MYLVAGGKASNKPKPTKKKPAVNAETERLRALLIKVIKLLAKYEPDTARELLDQVMPQVQPDFDDSLDDIGSDGVDHQSALPAPTV